MKTIATFFGKDPEKAKEEKLEKLKEQIKDVSVACLKNQFPIVYSLFH